MSLTPVPFSPRIRIVDPSSGYLTSQGYRFLQAMRVSLIGLEELAGDDTLASSLLKFEANATPGGGADAQIDALTRVQEGDAFTEAGLTIRSFVSGMTTSSQILLRADSLYFTDGTTDTAPFSIVAGVTTLQNVVVNGSLLINGTITSAKIGNLEVDTIKINYGAVTTFGAVSGSGSGNTSTWTTIASTTIANDSGVVPTLQLAWTIGIVAGSGQAATTMRVYNATSGQALFSAAVVANPGNSQTYTDFRAFLDTTASSGSQTYAIQIIGSGDVAGSGSTGSGTLHIAYQKR